MHLSHLFEDLEDWYSERLPLPRLGRRSGRGSRLPTARERSPRTRASSRPQKEVIDGFANQRHRRPQRVAAAAVAPPVGDGRQLRRALRGGDGARSAGRFQHAREPVRLDDRQARGQVAGRACGRAALRLLHRDGEHLRAGPPGDGRPLPGRQGHRASPRATPSWGSTASSARRTARTSSCRRGLTAPSRSPSSPERQLESNRLRLELGYRRGEIRRPTRDPPPTRV